MLLRSRNPQARHVGNLGDILKHAALVELAAMLVATSPTVRFVDTHGFLLHAPLADAVRWSREVDELADTHPAHARYAAHEREAVARTGRYRCSSGLVLDVLGAHRGSATFGEANGVTRAELRAQLRDEQHADVFVADDAIAALRQASVVEGGSLLVHVDPFTLTPEGWASLAPGLDVACERADTAVLVAYRYTRRARSAWPVAPRGTVGPVTETRGGPHEVAAYASANVAGAVRDVCGAMGWRAVGI